MTALSNNLPTKMTFFGAILVTIGRIEASRRVFGEVEFDEPGHSHWPGTSLIMARCACQKSANEY